jgi:mannosyltransferase OCH1-like enzyme
MIPKLIHFVWLPPSPGESELPKDMQRHVLEWRRLNPDFEIKIWGYADLQPLSVLESTNIGKYLHLCRFEAMKSDIARLAIIYEQGGFYSDLKNLPLQSFLDELSLANEALVVEHSPTIARWEGKIMNSFLAGPPKHEFFRECLIRIEYKLARRLGTDVASTTGAGPLGAVIAARQQSAFVDYRIIPSQQAWGAQGGEPSGWMKRTSASYNGPQMKSHWSVRQKTEGIFLDN